jgi:hypothetical protein
MEYPDRRIKPIVCTMASSVCRVDEDEELAAIKLTKDDVNFMFQTMMKESKYDELSIKQTVHGLNSAFTRLPIPHVSTSKESGAGKSYIVNHIASFYLINT